MVVIRGIKDGDEMQKEKYRKWMPGREGQDHIDEGEGMSSNEENGYFFPYG